MLLRPAPLRSARLDPGPGPPFGGTVSSGRRSQQPDSSDCCPSRRSLRTSSVQLCVSYCNAAGRCGQPRRSPMGDHSVSFSSFSARSSSVCGVSAGLSSAATHFSTGTAGADHEQRQQQQQRLGGCSECAPLRRLAVRVPAAGRIDFSAAEGRGAAGRSRSAAAADCESRTHHAARRRSGAPAMAMTTARQQQRAGRLTAANGSGSH